MKVEYLVLLDSKSTFCKTTKAFKNFLQSDAEIKIEANNLLYKEKNLNMNYREEITLILEESFFT